MENSKPGQKGLHLVPIRKVCAVRLFSLESFPGHIKASHPKTCSYSDHKLISITVRPSTQPKGKSFWKFRTALLQREDFCSELADTITLAKEESAELAPDTCWEFIKLKIREKSIAFSKKLREEHSLLEAETETRLLVLEKDLVDSPDDTREEYQGLKRELYQIQLTRARESMVRSLSTWVGEGESPTKYFLNLEKKQSTAKIMTFIRDTQGNLLEDPKSIMKFQGEYFSKQSPQDSPQC